MQDNLVFTAAWRSRPMTAKEVVDCSRDFLTELARVSPWDAPFDVSGASQRQAHMLIAEDLSNFDETTLKAMDNNTVRFFSESEPDEMRIRLDSKSAVGMNATFSDYPQRKSKKNSVRIEIGMGSADGSCNSGVSIHVPAYTPYTEENSVWAVSDGLEQPQAIFEFLINFFDPYFCSVYSSEFLLDVTEWGVDINSPIGWLSYVRTPKVLAALAGDSRVVEYHSGVLIKLGDSPSLFRDSSARKRAYEIAIEIRDKLREADATDWMAGANLSSKN